MSHGIDISHNNGVVDFTAVKASGIDFVMVRAGYGQLEDRQFKANIQGAAKAGIPVGVYYFSYALNAVKAEEEASHCLSLIKPYTIDFPVYFDFEYDSETFGAKKGVIYTAALRTAINKAFCERIRSAGYKPGIYTNADYITSKLNWSELKNYTLWLAQWPYGVDKNITFGDVKESALNTTWGKAAIWQFGKGTVGGCKTDTDLNFGYMALPSKPTVDPIKFKIGDKVKVTKTVTTGSIKRGKTYDGKTFVVYFDSYDIIAVSGKRVVIGRSKNITAAVNADDLQKI